MFELFNHYKNVMTVLGILMIVQLMLGRLDLFKITITIYFFFYFLKIIRAGKWKEKMRISIQSQDKTRLENE